MKVYQGFPHHLFSAFVDLGFEKCSKNQWLTSVLAEMKSSSVLVSYPVTVTKYNKKSNFGEKGVMAPVSQSIIAEKIQVEK